MSSSAGWIRVLEGAQLVASAMAKHAASEASLATNRATQHGVDLTSKAVASSQGVINRLQNQIESAASANRNDFEGGPSSTGYPSGTRNPYESQIHTVLKRTTKNDPTGLNGFANPTSDVMHSKKEVSNADTNDNLQRSDSGLKGTNTIPPSILLHAQKQSQDIERDSSTFKNDETVPLMPSGDSSNDPGIANDIGSTNAESSQSPQYTSFTGDSEIGSPDEEVATQKEFREGVAVPSSRVGRAFGFASLGVGLIFGTASEVASRMLTSSERSSEPLSSSWTNDANSDRLANTLCRMRGAALKMGQMLSIQDESLLPPALSRALHQVRQGADAMPNYQLLKQLESELGTDWREKFETFDEKPFAAASIGQVHRATIRESDGTIRDVVVKVQYPGVANSIESDLRNLTMLVKMTGLAPKGLFIDNVIRVGRDELKVECNYINEMANQKKFKELVSSDPMLVEQGFVVPSVVEELTTSQVLTSHFAPGGTIDKVSHLDQEERNRIGRTILYLTMKELFEWRLMQTDPNWGNFLYDVGSRTTSLIDFGATRSYSKEFVDGYLRIVWASANRDEEALMEQSKRMKFLTGEENDAMVRAHKLSGFTVGEPFWSNEPFDFQGSNISSRMSEHTSIFLKHRLTAPPEEVYTLHRKLAGAYMLCIKLGAVVTSRDMLEDIVANHVFEDGMETPIQKD